MQEIKLTNGLRFYARPGTSDANSAIACAQQDEYNIRSFTVAVTLAEFVVFDIGSHVGGVAILAASLGARVVAVEPVPPNVELIRANVALNSLEDYVTVLSGAVGTGEVSYGWTGDGLWGEETGAVHSFIGNTGLGLDREGYKPEHTVSVRQYTLTEIAAEYGDPYLIKLDCEGGEWAALAEPVAARTPVIVGEYHPWVGASVGATEHEDNYKRVLDLIGDTHEVTFPDTFEESAAGHFVALRR